MTLRGVGHLKYGGQGSWLVLGKVGAVRGFRANSIARAGKTGVGRQDRQVGPGAQRERRGRADWWAVVVSVCVACSAGEREGKLGRVRADAGWRGMLGRVRRGRERGGGAFFFFIFLKNQNFKNICPF